METKIDKQHLERVRISCGFPNGIEIEAEGSCGGLCLAWKEVINVTLRNFSKNHIDVMVKEENSNQEWRFTGFYGSPYSNCKNDSWNLLRKLGEDQSQPWLVKGDFNEIMYSFGKSGGIQREERRTEAFRKVLEECQLEDIGYSGVWFTWERGNFANTNIEERLDRGVENERWKSLFPTNPILEKLKKLQVHLKDWSGSIKKKREGLKKKLTKELEVLMAKESDDDTIAKIIGTRVDLNMEIDRDEIYWEQRARVN
ncbi:reverse transcriptase [Gossypium australe]|uniref:Reverse transcriptase n=1 Tax=Gossypium australe TaxID=47621 RepID=A0A5B6V077_9ROSI|nr:reverse transcriptase [Gossypium australe]